jgi:lipoprotein-anchoring transpeptidase ErfK/SrfK/ribosomal protein L12E/L44/L45/RPP1/RPP2
MNFRFRKISATFALTIAGAFFATSCENPPANNQTSVNTNTNQVVNTQTTNVQANSSQQASTGTTQAPNLPVTLPVLDAMFTDENFAGELKSRLNLTDEQIEKLRQTAREATAGLDEAEEGGSTSQAQRRAEEQIRAIVGDQKATELARFVSERWRGGEENAGMMGGSNQVNAVPGDTRIVVNAPAYRMDVFKDGQLVKTYKVGIGYPEFPLPTGMRKANEVIFNPTWTPPDEPWVKGKVKPGQKVEAGSKLNPLGPIKIPIGLPSLIHGGKSPARLGTFASHGCVGLTNQMVQDFAVTLAQISGTNITPEDVATYEKAKTETKNVKLSQAVPVELRYETIVVENGVLKIYRDVYERNTNTEENLRRVLEAFGVSMDSLNEQERTQALNGLKQMSVDPAGNPIDGNPGTSTNANANTSANASGKNAANNANKKNDAESGKVTRNIKGAKEVSIPIAALQGKGYPAPANLNTGDNSNTGNQKNTNQSPQQKANQTNRRL